MAKMICDTGGWGGTQPIFELDFSAYVIKDEQAWNIKSTSAACSDRISADGVYICIHDSRHKLPTDRHLCCKGECSRLGV